ncbi:type I glyceraldehyde-3-phosphate dehydrogenase [archaeon]|nr:type I glyceraldehyde-3-phosphate dehydrogenase [archaeon]|tara:strand:- start:3861 stop:4886 length:1026 start_codon:yes stop_codon:yes gene_type:complete
MTTKVGINGFGRIGRNILRSWLQNPKDIEIVAVNDLPMPVSTLAHLLKYDTVMGTLDKNITVCEEEGNKMLIIDGKEVKVFDKSNPEEIPWGAENVDVVVESTGIFRARDDAAKHITAGAKKVIVSAPSDDVDATLVLGVNDDTYDSEKHDVISNASCTTNCLAPIAKVLLDNYGIKHGLMTTVHSYTSDQKIHDLAHKDLRRARAGAENIIPTTTGAAKALGKVVPALDGKMDGMALRVPTPNVSLVDLVCELENDTTVEDVNQKLKEAAEGSMKGVLDISDEPLVSKDYNGNPYSSIVDSMSTNVIDGKLVKIISWYDNEWGYSNRVLDLINLLAEKGM